MAAATAAVSPGQRLRALLSRQLVTHGSSLALPGAFNGLVARAVAQEGFQGAYVSGAGVAAGMGLPDIGLAGLEDFCRVIRDVSTASGLPVLSDADTGFGEGVEGVARVVHEYSRAGAAGLHLEDQVFPKRCGHLDGKQLVPADHFAAKVTAAARARDALAGAGSGGFIICARTDARGVEGLEAAVERAKRFVDAGADMVFPEGLASLAEFHAVGKALRGYNGANGGEGPFLLANMTEWGKTPLLSTEQFGRAGFHCTIFPMTLFRFAMRGVLGGLRELREHGRVLAEEEGGQEEDVGGAGAGHGARRRRRPPLEERMLTRQETYELLGYTPSVPWQYPSPNHGGGGKAGGGERTGFRQ